MRVSKEKLERYMARSMLTYQTLSEKSGVSVVTISRLKKGAQKPKPVTLGKIAKAIGCDVTEIIEAN